MEKLQPEKTLGINEERILWEGLASASSSLLVRLGAFLLLGFATFITVFSAVLVAYNLLGIRTIPERPLYGAALAGLLIASGGYVVWLWRSLRTYRSFSGVLRRSGLDPLRPSMTGLRVYSDEQLLALRSRYEHLHRERLRKLFEDIFGFSEADSFTSGPLSVRPGMFEMNALIVEWEANLILKSVDGVPPAIGWWKQGQLHLLPRLPDEPRRLFYALSYTKDSVKMLKRRYGFRVDSWYRTVPDGMLWNAVRDYEDHRKIQAALARRRQGF